ncbi:hypothetical protein [Streptomyces parvus]|uniref:hypothetical protein n=1 Tax=Streptomyces parvus TaxID=66428 RepID=UPI00362D9F5F
MPGTLGGGLDGPRRTSVGTAGDHGMTLLGVGSSGRLLDHCLIAPCDAGPPVAVGWEAEQGSGGGGGSRTWVL